MKIKILLSMVLLASILFSWKIVDNKWIVEKQKGYSLWYTASDEKNIVEYKDFIEAGKKTVEEFFQGPYDNDFSIYIHPSRISLDSTWQKDWNMPGFKSQCWMVASGVSSQLDIISPKKWDSLACEHSYSNSIKTQQLIAHELVHVYHGQQNKSPDFSDISGIDWFVEGLAVYASGQCDTERIADVKNAVSENNIPENLSDFWTGKLKYGLSGTVVMFLDKKYGREMLISLLRFNDIKDITSQLNTSEEEILKDWKKYIEEI